MVCVTSAHSPNMNTIDLFGWGGVFRKFDFLREAQKNEALTPILA